MVSTKFKNTEEELQLKKQLLHANGMTAICFTSSMCYLFALMLQFYMKSYTIF